MDSGREIPSGWKQHTFCDVVLFQDAISIRFNSDCWIKIDGVERFIVPGDVLTFRLK